MATKVKTKTKLADSPAVQTVSSQILDTKFGRPEDRIEINIFNKGSEVISTYSFGVKKGFEAGDIDGFKTPGIGDKESEEGWQPPFTSFEDNGIFFDINKAEIITSPSNPPGTDLEPSNSNPQPSPAPLYLFDTVDLNPSYLIDENDELEMGATYEVIYNFLRPKIILNSDLSPSNFLLKTISPSRTEIEIQNINVNNQILENAVINFITDLNSYEFFRDFVVNFTSNKIFIGLNIALNKTDPNNYTIYIKLFEPLPNNISIGDSLFIEEKITDSISLEVSTPPSPFIPSGDVGISIRPANFTLDITKNLSVPTDYKTYDDLLLTENSSSYRRLLNKMSSVKPTIEYEDYVSGSTTISAFNNFVHFGSATERLKNFKYKIGLYELYNGQIDELSSSPSSNAYISANTEIIDQKINTLIENLDNYESYLFYESTSFAWPKSNNFIPYTLYSATSSQALTWLGSEIESDLYYGGRLASASLYDKLSPHNLLNTVPLHIRDNSDNKQYEIFVQMIGQHFDQIWTYIDDIGEIKDADNSPNRGINRDLVYYALKSVGLDAFKANFDRTYVQDLLETSVSASNLCDFVEDQIITDTRNINSVTGIKTSLNDYNKDIWKRIYHNVPYLLKTRGTERGLRALINCYGIPDTVLQVKEFGGPQKTGTSPNYYIHNKYSYGYSMNEGIDTYSTITSSFAGRIVHNEYIESLGPRTVEFRFKTPYKEDQIIWEKGFLPATSEYYTDGYADPGYVESLTDNDFNFVMSLEHSSSATAGTYNESPSQYYDYGRIVFTATGGPSGTEVMSGSLTPYAPIYDGDWWNLSFRVPATGSLIMETDLQKAPDGLEKQYSNIIKHIASGDFDFSTIRSGSEVLNDFYYNSLVTVGRGFSGSLQEYREYNEYLDEDVLKGHTESPEMFNGNTYSSSFESLYFRLSLGFDLETTFISGSGILMNMCNVDSGGLDLRGNLNSIHPDQNTKRIAQVSGSFIYTGNEETLYTRYPNGSSANLSSNKIRIESSSFDDPPILSFNVRGEEPAYDTMPIDSAKLGVYFSPTYEMDRDITGELGLYDMDQFIGDPSDIDKTKYTDIELLEDHYKKKKPTNLNRYKFEDYIRLVQFFDTSLFDTIEQFVPARVNLMKGLVIEPTLFDRNKIPTFYPSLQNLIHSGSILSSSMTPSIGSEYLLTEFGYTLSDHFNFDYGSNPLYGNFVAKKPSIFYATVVTNSTLVSYIPPDGGIGGIPPYEAALGEAIPETPGGPPGGDSPAFPNEGDGE